MSMPEKVPAVLSISVLVVAAVALFGGAAPNDRQAARVPRWEYRIERSTNARTLDLNDTMRLNILGREGWELVSVSFRGDNNLTNGLYFKRRLP
jgi:hypothetical protein